LSVSHGAPKGSTFHPTTGHLKEWKQQSVDFFAYDVNLSVQLSLDIILFAYDNIFHISEFSSPLLSNINSYLIHLNKFLKTI